MAKIRKIPAAYEGTRGVPAQYTTDPDVATPEQVAAIGSALDKARKLSRGQRITKSMVGAAPIPTTPVRLNRTSGSTLRSPAGAPNIGIGGGAPIATAPAAFNATSKSPQQAGNGFSAGLKGGRGTLRIQPNVEKLSPSEAASLKMLESSLVAQELDPKNSDDYTLLQEILGRKQLVDPEQNRLKALFRRMDNLYHPETMTLGGADHWSEDPSARLAGRAHVSVNIHHAYVQIPAAIQAVRPVINYVPTGSTKEDRIAASYREQLFFRWWESNEMDLQMEQAALLKELYGHTAAKIYWDPIERVPKISIIERPENLYLGFGNSDYNRLDWALYTYGMSPQSIQEDYGVDVIPVKQGEKWFPYTSRGSHADPIGNVWANAFERNPLRRETAYEQMQVEVYDYWYKVPKGAGKAPLVYNAIYVGNTLVKNEAHPEYGGQIPYIHLPNGKIPGSPYGKPALYDPEQLLREKDERITAMAQMIQSIVGGQMWQLVGAEAPDEVPPNALPKPGRVATPGPGNELRAIQPFIPQFQIEAYVARIDRELTVATGLNDLLLGLAPAQVLGSSRAIAALIANYESRLAPKRKVYYAWLKKVWEMCARIWEAKDPGVKSLIAGEYRIEIVAPELTPRDTLELASTAINLVQNRLWSAERAMDRVGVEDPIGEKELIRDEQTDATLNPAAVATMTQVIGQMQQMQMQQQQAGQMAQQQQLEQQMMMTQAQAQNAQRTLTSGVPGDQSLNQPENQAQLPPEANAQNAAAPGEQNLVPAPTATNEVQA
jgi:hypothetical protein